jgi:hypothetical protein
VLIADTFNNAIRVITSTGAVVTLAGDPDEGTVVDGPLASARFQSPKSFLDDGAGGFYVADAGNNSIRHVDAQGEVTTFAGGVNARGQTHVDGPRLDARFFAPGTMVMDSAGVIYVTDQGNHAVRRIGTDGMVSTIAGEGRPGYIDGDGASARFNGPDGLLLVDDSTLIVADALNDVLRRVVINADGSTTVSLFAGKIPMNDESRPGSEDGIGSAASFRTPRTLLRDGDSILIADSNNSLLRRVGIEDRAVTTVAGTAGRFGIAAGPTPGSLFEPQGLVFLPDGKLLLTSYAALISIDGLR